MSPVVLVIVYLLSGVSYSEHHAAETEAECKALAPIVAKRAASLGATNIKTTCLSYK
jgi:hypothetical protein